MDDRIVPSEYFPNRSPTWTDVVAAGALAGFLGVVTYLWADVSSISPTALVVSTVVALVSNGLYWRSEAGTRFDRWFRRLDTWRRIVLFVPGFVLGTVAVGTVVSGVRIPDAVGAGVGYGLLLGLVLYLVAFALWGGTVSGWRREWEPID